MLGLGLLVSLFAESARAEIRNEEFPLAGDIANVKMALETFEPSPKGVLVLVGRADDAEWRQFAQDNHLALCLVRLVLSAKALANAKTWGNSPAPVPNAGSLLFKALTPLHLAGKPIYAFGFRDGGNFVCSLANDRTLRVSAWACQAATRFPVPAREIPYGIVAASDLDRSLYDQARSYVRQLRKRGAAMAWISLPGKVQQNLKLEAFVRDCFAARLAASSVKAIAVDNETRTEVPIPTGPEAAGATSILPSATVLAGWSALHQPNDIVTTTVATGVKEFPRIVLALRLPADPEPQARILAYSYYFTSVGNVLQLARDDKFGWNKFAAKRGMATLTWNVETLWQNQKSFDQIESGDALKQSRTFDAVARALDAGILKLASQYQLRDSGILMYGCSRGANFALRLAMREPQRFSAVVAHIANSFERPQPAAGGVVWAITNGQLDPGAKNARRYYDQCRALGLPFFLRLFPELRHDENKESLGFAMAFFDYILSEERTAGNLARRLATQSEKPAYVADLANALVFPADKKDAVPPGQRVGIPNEEMARLWGRLIP